MATEEDWDEMDEMLTVVERQMTTCLKKIKQPHQRRTFKKKFIKAVKLRVESAYSRLDAKLEMGLSRDQTSSIFTAENNMNLLGHFGPLRQVKIESNGDVIELSDEDDDDDGKLMPKKECSEAPNESAHHGNQQFSTIGKAPAIGLMDDSDSEIESEVTNDTPSTSSGTGAKNKDSSTNMDRPATVENIRQQDEDKGSVGAKNVTKTAKDKQKRHKCQICGYNTIYKTRLVNHYRIHTGRRLYQCNKCSKSSSRSSDLKRHELIHVKQYKFRCVRCARGFNEEIKKVRHDKKCEKHRFECYLCKPPHAECMYVTNRIDSLKDHMRTHTGEKPFRCEICMKRFGRKSNLKKHLSDIHNRADR